MRSVRTAVPLAAALVFTLLAASRSAVPASADVFELADGTKLDGRLVQEKDGFVWIRTLVETRKVAAADIRSRTPGEAPVDVYAALKAKVEKEPKNVEALWALYLFCAEHAAESKDIAREAKAIPPRVVKLAPEHEEARDAVGDVKFEGRWVKKVDLARLEAEAARKKKQDEWQERTGVLVEVADGEHWTIVDNTGAKDLSKKVKELDDLYRLTGEALGADRFWDGTATALVFKRHPDYVRYLDSAWKGKMSEWRFNAARDRALGGFWTQNPMPFQARCIPDSKTDAEEGMWAAVAHNVVHVCIWSQKRASEPPAWLEEGLAAILEFEVRGISKAWCVGTQDLKRDQTTDKPAKGSKNGNAALAGEQAVVKEHCKKAVEDDTFPEMRKFLRMKLGEFGPVEVGGAIGLVTWLRAKDPEKFKALWKEIRGGFKTDDDPWRKVYEYRLIEDMEKEWKTWVRSEW